MNNLRWPVIVVTAVLALALWGGFRYYHQRYLKEAPLVEKLTQVEGIERAEIRQEHGETVILIDTSPAFRGSISDLYSRAEELALPELAKPVRIKLLDHCNGRLELFARDVSPGLYEGARLGNYREIADDINRLAEKHGLREVEFAVDYRRLYVQGRDGEYYLYLIVEVAMPEGGSSDA